MTHEHKELLSKLRILIVEDDDKTRLMFEKTILKYVDDVYSVKNGSEALELYSRKKPDIIITDINMPLMDGLTLVTVIRQMDRDIPIVAISGHKEIDTLVKIASMKLVDYVIKPVSYEQLKTILSRCAAEIEEKGRVETRLTAASVYSYSAKSIRNGDQSIPLTPNEIALLELLLKNEKRLVSNDLIEDTVYDGEAVTGNAINTLVSKLRKKIGANIINSVHSHGYILVKES